MARKSLRRLQYECENLVVPDLSDEEVTRYGIQMMVGIGASGQRNIREAKVLVVGVGAAGSALLVQLSAAGIGELGIIDPGEISETHPAKEPIFAGVKPGGKKAESAKETITDLNPLVTVNVYPVSVKELDHANVVPRYSILACCTDDIQSRYLLSDLAVMYQKPLVLACALQTEGHCLILNHRSGPCYRCLFPEPPRMSYAEKFKSHQSDVGVFPGLKAIVGGMLAVEVLKMVLGRKGLNQEVIVYEAVQGTITKHRMRGKRPDCPACSGSPFDLNTYDYSQLTKATGRPHAELLAEVPEGNKLDPAVYFKVRDSAVNIPVGQLSNYVVRATQDNIAEVAESQPVVLICRRGVAATQACHILMKRNIKSSAQADFFLIVGGLNACSKVNPKVPFY